MTELPPDVRDRAARALYSIETGRGHHQWVYAAPSTQEKCFAKVDAVAEVTAADGSFWARYREYDRVATDRDALKARVDLLTTALTEIVAANDASTDQLPRSMWSAITRARAVLSATPTESAVNEHPDENTPTPERLLEMAEHIAGAIAHHHKYRELDAEILEETSRRLRLMAAAAPAGDSP
jgi:hypothetical protein